jgi:hypothetical protein
MAFAIPAGVTAALPYALAGAPYVFNIGKKYADPGLSGLGGAIGSLGGKGGRKIGKAVGHTIASGLAAAFGYANGGLVVRPRLPMKSGGYQRGGRVVVSNRRPACRRRF